MNLGEYERHGRHAYSALAAAVASIIRTVAEQQDEYRVQQVQHRAKDVASLSLKLAERGVTPSSNIEREIKDLSGCRIILYTNADVSHFISSGAISDNFEVDWARTKFHYPMQEPTAEEGFISYNYVIRLKADRLALPEYARFTNMACEVQVQTTLDHAWSEMAHDTIYKPPPAGFGSAVMQGVSDRMTEIIQKYLRPAGLDFQKIASDVRALEKGRLLFEQDPLKLLGEATDNNDRYRLLDEFEQYVIPNYDDLVGLAPAIRDLMVATVKKARETPTRPLVVDGLSLGRFGYDGDQCATKALEVIDHLRFVSAEAIDATFNAICELYPGASDKQRVILLRSLERLAQHNMDMWQAAGSLVEERLLKLISGFSEARRSELRPVLIATLRYALQPGITGTTSTYDQFHLRMGGVIPSEAYLKVRREAISILQNLFLSSTDPAEQREILQAFGTAGRFPDHGELAGEFVRAVYADAIGIVAFMGQVIALVPFEILQSYEHDLVWKYRHSSALPLPHREDAELNRERLKFREAILSFRDQLNGDPEFVIYKTLVGFESVLAPSWNDDGFGIEEEARYRDAEIKRLVEGIDEDNFDQWIGRIRRCARTKSNDGATFPSFRSFLVELGRRKPVLLSRLFDNLDDDLDWFVSSMLLGLEGGPLEAEMRKRAHAWVDEQKHLLQVIAYCDVAAEFDPNLFEAALKAAIRGNDDRAAGLAMGVCINRREQAPKRLPAAFSETLFHFSKRRQTRWVDDVWFRAHGNDFVANLPAKTRNKIFLNLINSPEISYRTEEILVAASKSEPLKLLEFFLERLQKSDRRDADERYEAVPFQFHRLAEDFKAVGREVVQRIRRSFDLDASLFEYRAGGLIHHFYPQLGGVEQPLLELARTGEETDIKFLVAVLRGYQGASFLLPLWREIVRRLDSGSALLKEIDFSMDLSGVVSGEFGFVELHRLRRSEIEPWLLDTEERVRVFAERRIQQLNLMIASEQRRAFEQLELRKRNYGG